jgi:hypothetical protein
MMAMFATTERILAEIANPSMLGATPDTDPMASAIARLRAVDPPINNLGDEMVLFAAGLASGGSLPAAIRALPYAGRFAQQRLLSMRGLTAEAERKLAAVARSFSGSPRQDTERTGVARRHRSGPTRGRGDRIWIERLQRTPRKKRRAGSHRIRFGPSTR